MVGNNYLHISLLDSDRRKVGNTLTARGQKTFDKYIFIIPFRSINIIILFNDNIRRCQCVVYDPYPGSSVLVVVVTVWMKLSKPMFTHSNTSNGCFNRILESLIPFLFGIFNGRFFCCQILHSVYNSTYFFVR